ncbi:ABC transporter ATP-binding protein [Phytoactinopolyspora mesophila]|uniref:ABC-type quaternary amine transporter n=1 Tax=Phytoactinopolyspora mesophila TaxID=2650750 RepID=A0A7K3LWZ9_9ACTN|nr:ABC transporter ATP-binding protein [Phytoactinopolyspora mesophila]NDL55554.1 ATP-binding cassette domain-containing protein [Phytoactinopolyspora mesophila]
MIELDSLNKSFDGVQAVRELNLEIHRGEFLCLLGPSGCGKSTTLRMIAGFIQPDSGRIRIDGADVSGYGPDARPTAMVFQDYAIFPHLSVAENIEFGLKAQRVGKAERASRVPEVLDLVGLGGLGARRPGELSGGQQQRVAVARALAIRPSVLLMDEPLSNLDAKTRIHLRTQLRDIQRDTGTTIVYVTHDQEEALALGDRIAVMKDGSLEQLGSGRDIYRSPGTGYVADFVGVTNWLAAELVAESSGGWELAAGGSSFRATPGVRDRSVVTAGVVDVSLRPEDVRLAPDGGADGAGPGDTTGDQVLRGVVRDEQFLGPMVRTFVQVGEDVLMVHSAHGGWAAGASVRLLFSSDDARAYPRGEQEWRPPSGDRTPATAAAR